MMKNNIKTCCFIGHRDIKEPDRLKNNLTQTIKTLISDENVETFLFGSRSDFNDLCYDTVSKLRAVYPHIRRVYVRAEFPYINDDYERFLLERYEQTYYPEKIIGAGRAVYIERNYKMIDNSDFCVFYYDEKYTVPKRKSGTKITYEYAVKKEKRIINIKEGESENV